MSLLFDTWEQLRQNRDVMKKGVSGVIVEPNRKTKTGGGNVV